MNDRDQRRYDRLTRIQTFARENAPDFALGSKAKELFDSVDSRITDLEAAKAGQVPARVSKQTLLDGLWLDFKNIARTARSIALTENGFASPYRLPEVPTEAAITTHADSLLQILEDQPNDSAAVKAAKAGLRGKFVAYEMPGEFVEDLRADREAVRNANKVNQGEIQEGIENTELIGQILEAAALDVQQLDAIMNNKYSRQPEKLRAWQSASRVERAPQRAKKSATGTTPPAAPPK